MLEGRVKCRIGQKEIVLEAGDSLYFDANYEHGIQSDTDDPAKFLAIVLD